MISASRTSHRRIVSKASDLSRLAILSWPVCSMPNTCQSSAASPVSPRTALGTSSAQRPATNEEQPSLGARTWIEVAQPAASISIAHSRVVFTAYRIGGLLDLIPGEFVCGVIGVADRAGLFGRDSAPV